MGIVYGLGLGLFSTPVRALNNQLFTEIDHTPWQAQHYELTINSNKIIQK